MYNQIMDSARSLHEVTEQLQRLMPELISRYSVRTIGIFGSYVRAEQRPDSDLDLLVTFSDPPGLIKFIALENYLSDSLGLKVDLVMKTALKPALKERILEEVQSV